MQSAAPTSARASGRWARGNRIAYRALAPWPAVRGAWAVRRALRGWQPARSARPAPRPALWIGWGRLGDTVIASGVLARLRGLLGRPLVMVAREALRPLLEPHVDRFVGFHAGELQHVRGWRALLERLDDDYEVVAGDVHLFHGGLPLFAPLIERLPATAKLCYEGWAPASRVAPWRPWPRAATVLPSLPKPRDAELERLHVWHDVVHYTHAVLRHLGREAGDALQPAQARPRVELGGSDAPGLERHGLHRGGYIACQPRSDNPRKDWPAASWQAVWKAFPEVRFALLGGTPAPGETELASANVVDLRGRTTLDEAAAVVRQARAFVGVDSGLTHLAAAVGQRVVCVAQSANLGYFFPYPPGVASAELEVVAHPEYRPCAGCLAVCEHEPLWAQRHGVPCVRTLPAEPVVEAVRRALGGGEVVRRDGVHGARVSV